MSAPLSQEQIALSMFTANLPAVIREATRYGNSERQRAFLKAEMSSAFAMAELWEELCDERDKEDNNQQP